MPAGGHRLTLMMTEPATVVFETGLGPMTALTLEPEGRKMRFARVTSAGTRDRRSTCD